MSILCEPDSLKILIKNIKPDYNTIIGDGEIRYILLSYSVDFEIVFSSYKLEGRVNFETKKFEGLTVKEIKNIIKNDLRKNMIEVNEND